MSGRRAHRLFFSILLAALAGCGDAGPIAVDAGPMVDAPPLRMSRLLGACVSDAQCPGNGALCRTAEQGYPMGQCTIPCTDRTACDDGAVYNRCLMLRGETSTTCIGFCRNGSDCRPGYTCQITSPARAPMPEGLCIPVCGVDADCGGTSQCDPYTGRCVARGMVGMVGAITGAACTGNSDCRSGNCRMAMETGRFTGFVGGYCESLCRIPSGYNTTDFFSGNALPAGTCAGSAVCLPGGNQQGVNDLGVCLGACTSATDCRPGYTCRQMVGAHTFTNGWCTPIDCLGAGPCPAGSACHMARDAQGNPYGICG